MSPTFGWGGHNSHKPKNSLSQLFHNSITRWIFLLSQSGGESDPQSDILSLANLVLCLHYVPGGPGSHVSDNRDQNGINVRQRRGTG